MCDSPKRTAIGLARRRENLQHHYLLLRGTLAELRRQRAQLQAQIPSVEVRREH